MRANQRRHRQRWDPRYWSPSEWWRGDLGVTQAANLVTNWQGQIAGTNAAAAGALRPGYNATGINGLPQLTFSGSQYLQTGAETVNRPDTIVIVGSSTQVGSQGFIDGDTALRRQSIFTAANVPSMFSGATLANGGKALTSPSIIFAQFNGATSNLFVNNSQVAWASGDTGTNTNIGATIFIGALIGGAGPLIGTIDEIVLVPRLLTATEQAQFTAYANTRYNLAYT